MTLLAPWGLLLSLLAIPVLLMYMLKLRRWPREVSSTLFWRRALEDLQANSPWQKLRRSLLLLLQLLALLALVLAVAAPAYSSTHRFNGDLIIILDESYGMQAHDVKPTRFRAAQARARTLVADLPSGHVASIIGMSTQPEVAAAETANASLLNQAIDRLHGGTQAPNFSAALSVAASLDRSGVATRAVVLTSRESGISGLPMAVPFQVQIVRLGDRPLHPFRDVALTAFNVSAAGKGTDRHTQGLARIANFGTQRGATNLRLVADGNLVDVRHIALAPGAHKLVLWPDLPRSARTFEASLTTRDDLSLDKNAWSLVGAPVTRHLLIVGGSDYFLQTALELDPTVQLSAIDAAGYHPSLAARYDLIIFDGFLPKRLPEGSCLLVDPPSGDVGIRGGIVSLGKPALGGQVETQNPPSPSLDPILAFLDLSDVQVAKAQVLVGPSWIETLATAGTTPVLAAGENGASRLAIMPFSLQDSNWPLRISFPVMMRNLVHFLAPGLAVNQSTVSVGQSVTFSPPGNVRTLEIHSPRGGTKSLHAPFAPFTGTQTPGLYTVRTEGGATVDSARFAVNFLPDRPQALAGKPTLVIGHVQKSSWHGIPVPVSLAWPVALAALALLTTEWWVAFRR